MSLNSALSDDVSSWTKEQLSNFLGSYGFEDLDNMTFDDMLSLVTVIESTFDNPHPPTEELLVPPAEPSAPEADEKIHETLLTDVQTETIDSPNPVVDDEEHINLVLALCEATGIDFEDAQKALQDVNWNLSTAIASHYDGTDIAQQQIEEQRMEEHRQTRTRVSLGTSTATTATGEDPISAFGAGLLSNAPNPWSYIHGQISQMGDTRDDEDDYDSYTNRGDEYSAPLRKKDEYDEEGIRKPDPVRSERLMRGFEGMHHRMSADNSLARADDPSVEWIYSPPGHLSYPGPFQEVRTMSNDEKKWLVVNLQSHNEFASHMLNRDTWTDETIEAILRSSFIFWQRGHTSQEGRSFMDAYRIPESDLPNISIIDPRTGARILSIKGFISHDDLSVLLMEFIESNSLDSENAPVVRQIDTTVWKKYDSKSLDDTFDAPVPPETAETLNVVPPVAEPTLATPIASEPEVVNYGPPPTEPGAEEKAIKISIKLPGSGKPLVRRFYDSNTVQELFAFVDNIEGRGRRFDLLTSFPTASLTDKLESTLQDASLSGSQIIMRWL